MNIFELLGILNALENNFKLILKTGLVLFLTESILWFIQTYDIYNKIILAISFIQNFVKFIIIAITFGPSSYFIGKALIFCIRRIREWFINFITPINFLWDQLRQNKEISAYITTTDMKVSKPHKKYILLESFDSISVSTSRLKLPIENQYYHFRYNIFLIVEINNCF